MNFRLFRRSVSAFSAGVGIYRVGGGKPEQNAVLTLRLVQLLTTFLHGNMGNVLLSTGHSCSCYTLYKVGVDLSYGRKMGYQHQTAG